MLESGSVKLVALFRNIEGFRISGDGLVEVSSLAYHSDEVKSGSLFFCVPGFVHDGHRFAGAAVEKGAAALCVERLLDVDVPQVIVSSVAESMAAAAAAFYGYPSSKLQVVGITGTNGKTTTAFLTAHMLDCGGRTSGLLGTVERRIGGASTPAIRTTPEAVDIQADLSRMLESGDDTAVMEVSSHALALHRVDHVRFAVSAFTNLTQDHLDFHADLDEYYAAKSRLFMDPVLGADTGWAVVNVGDKYGWELAGRLAADRLLTFGVGDATEHSRPDMYLEGLSFDYSGFEGVLVLRGAAARLTHRNRTGGSRSGVEVRLAVRSRLVGIFNAANALAAAGICLVLGMDPEEIGLCLADFEGVPGRMERVDVGQPFALLVDYAHTPDSVDNVLRAVRGIGVGKVITVMGCGGDRDRGKRPMMGKTAEGHSDVLVVTSDNPRSEDPEAIIGDILGGLDRPGSAIVEKDRRVAIQSACGLAEDGDVVMILGKGHETGQAFADHTIPFDDRSVAAEILRDLWGGGA